MKEVELPTGEIAEFPDSMPDDQIATVLRNQFGRQQSQQGGDFAAAPVSPNPSRFQGVPATAGSYADSYSPFRSMTNPLSDINADITTGLPAGQRAATSIKVSPAGKMNYLESKYGPGNVAIRSDGETFVRDPSIPNPMKQWRKVDESDITLRDVADWSGPVLEGGPTVAAGLLTGGNPAAVGAGQVLGSTLRHTASGLLPGSDEMSLLERGGDVALKGLLAAGTQYGFNKLFPVADKLRPHNIVARNVQKSMETPYAQRGQLLQKETGIEFSPGQMSGSRGQLMLEGLARQHPASADKVMAFDVKQAQRAVQKLNSVMDKIDPTRPGAIQIGQRVSGAFDNAVKSSLKARSSQAKVDFGQVDALAGNAPVIPTTNTKAAIQQIIDDLDVPGGGDVTATLVNRLKQMGGEISGDGLTAQQTQRLLQVYGNAAKGSGQLFKDIDSAQQRMVAGRVFGALLKDLDDAANVSGQGGNVAQALKMARDNYRANSQSIDDLETSVLGRLFGGKFDPAPEAIADKFLRMRPSEIQSAVKILNSQNPQAVQGVKRHMLQSAMEEAVPSSSGTQAGGVMFSPRKFNAFIQKNSDQLRAIMSPKELVEVKRTYEALQRVVDRAGMEGSQTAPLTMALDLARGVFTTNPKDMVRAGVAVVAPKRIAQAMTTEQGRRALMTLTSTSAKTKARTAAAAILTELWAKEDMEMRAASTEADVLRDLETRQGQIQNQAQ